MIATAIMPGDPPAATCASPAAALRAGPGRRQAPPLPPPSRWLLRRHCHCSRPALLETDTVGGPASAHGSLTCVALGVSLPEPHFPHLQSGDNDTLLDGVHARSRELQGALHSPGVR